MLNQQTYISGHTTSHHHSGPRCCRRWPAAASTRCSAISRRDVLESAPLFLATQPALASEAPPGPPDDGFLDILPLPHTPAQSPANKKKFRRPPPKVPQVKLAPGLKVSKIIKGCWQLDGQHKGEASSDRTSGAAALEDLDTFAAAGACLSPSGEVQHGCRGTRRQHCACAPCTACAAPGTVRRGGHHNRPPHVVCSASSNPCRCMMPDTLASLRACHSTRHKHPVLHPLLYMCTAAGQAGHSTAAHNARHVATYIPTTTIHTMPT
jgi:hypothetical protein